MKTVSLRELHARTGELVRTAAHHGKIRVTDHGQVIATIVPWSPQAAIPYFARRTPTTSFKKLDQSGKTARGANSTAAISEERAARA